MDLFGSSNDYGWQLRNNGIHLGEDLDGRVPCYLNPDWLKTHLYIDGPTGQGKTSFLRRLVRYLSHVENASVVLINEKGELARNCRDAAIYDGFASRLEFVDLSDPNIAVSYNPLKEFGLPMSAHAKALTEACRSAWGQADFDKTPQLRRFLFATFFVALEQRLTMTQAIDLLRPVSPLRVQLLPEIKDPFSKSMFLWFDGLRDTRIEEITASTLARIEPFVNDPLVRRVIANPYPSLTMADVVNHQKFLILNLEVYRPWRPDDVRLIGRLWINSLLAQIFARPKEKRTPVFLVIDELADFISDDLTRALSQGRELGLHCILSTQSEDQLEREDGTGHLRKSVLQNARTKFVFSGVDPVLSADYLKSIFFSTLDPYRVKDEIRGLELIPHETTRVVESTATNESASAGISFPESESEGTNQVQTKGTGRNRTSTNGKSLSLGVAEADTFATAITKASATTEIETETHGDGEGHGTAHGSNDGHNSQSGAGWSSDPDGNLTYSGNSLTGINRGSFDSYSDAYSSSDSFSSGRAQTESEALTNSYAKSLSRSLALGLQQSQAEGESENQSLALGKSNNKSRGKTPSFVITKGTTESSSIVPFYEYEIRRPIVSRTFMPTEEQLLLQIQKLNSLSVGCGVILVPGHHPVFLRLPYSEPIELTPEEVEAELIEMYARPHYTRIETIEAEEERQRPCPAFAEDEPIITMEVKHGKHGSNPSLDIVEFAKAIKPKSD